MTELHQDFNACCMRHWLGLPLTALQYVIDFQFCGWRNVYAHQDCYRYFPKE